ncbi:nucleoside triphosphate pyrophosphohydrolase family protein [Micromonospora sp. NPDC049060]|uniref:nucleoside triphosphate pyrophosphohydrolase family protein n=1 Tax=Micromonospora sp. NPDC049060 TaxID=3154828 RepID=UPI00340D774E
MRDGSAYQLSKQHIREELGDVLWYVAMLAAEFGLDLEDVAAASLEKVKDRWRPSELDQPLLDHEAPEHEQLPRLARFTFTPTVRESDGRTVISLTCDGQPVGDPLTDASHLDDDYCFHDAFHLAYLAVLGWSPVMRSLLRRKRKSVPDIDEAEDGGRAIAIEEGISAMVFSYASRHGFFEGIRHVDNELLKTIGSMVAHLEVSVHRSADWERAIMVGYECWRQLREQKGGVLEVDMLQRTMRVV